MTEREAALRASSQFMCIVSDAYLVNPHGLSDIRLAHELGKPIFALVTTSKPLPPGYLPPEARIYEANPGDREEMRAQMANMVRDIRGNGDIDDEIEMLPHGLPS